MEKGIRELDEAIEILFSEWSMNLLEIELEDNIFMIYFRMFSIVIVIIQSRIVRDHMGNENITISLKSLKFGNLLGSQLRPCIILLNGRKYFFHWPHVLS